ncbi:MAG: 2-oxo acid dehydrogenase subunit E2, partial [Rudaea sp.]
ERLGQEAEVSYTDLIIKAVALALTAHPRLNARLVGEEIELPTEVNIGVAVSLDQGLIVPVLHHLNDKPLREIAAETKRLVMSARAGTLREFDLTGGTFSITNLGMYGIDEFTPIIDPPEIAILGIGRIVTRPVQKDGALAWRQMLTLSLTFDHRAVDGAPAAEFLQTVRERLEDPTDLA